MIEVGGLTIRYGDVAAVRHLSFTAPAGEVTAVVGPNGAGKTSTIEALEGFRRPTEGHLSVLGLDPCAEHAQLVRRMGVMLQTGGIHPAIRVREALEHAAALYPRSWRPSELVDRVGLGGFERRSYRSLSGGEQRRLALALALAGRPDVVFLDEPTAGVDPEGRRAIRELVAELRADAVTVVLASHELDEVERMADRVVMLDRGRLVAEGTVLEITAAHGAAADGPVVRFRAGPGLDVSALASHLGVEVAEIAMGEYEVRADPTSGLLASLTAWLAEAGVVLDSLRTGRPSLEDAFFRLTGGPSHPEEGSDR